MEKDQLPRGFWHYCGNESMNWTVHASRIAVFPKYIVCATHDHAAGIGRGDRGRGERE